MTRRFDDLRRSRRRGAGPVEWILAGLFTLLGTIGVGAVLAIMLGWPRPAHAHWTGTVADPAIASWYKDQHNSAGQWCCDESDGHPYFGEWSANEDGSVTVELNGKKHVLPKHMILTGPNPTGHAVWWFTDVEGVHMDYCFAPGTLS